MDTDSPAPFSSAKNTHFTDSEECAWDFDLRQPSVTRLKTKKTPRKMRGVSIYK